MFKKSTDKVYHDVMLDIETLGTDTNAVVLSIGAVKFRLDTRDNQDTLDDESRSFYAVLDIEDQTRRGRKSDPNTIEWWQTQSRKARSVFNEEGEEVQGVVAALGSFLKNVRRVWGNGNMFDNAIVQSLFDDYDEDYPVHYTGDLDLRTLTYIFNSIKKAIKRTVRPSVKFKGTVHNALDDAKRQVMEAQSMFSFLQGPKYYGYERNRDPNPYSE